MELSHIVVLAKQVPDTRAVGKDAMKADGTVNRGALPAIFNPEDLNALEVALRLKDSCSDVRVTVLTMGPPRATEILREGLYRGADGGVLLTDRAFAGADTLATSYALACAVKRLSPSLVIGGRQAIDGDTAQVGPQVAQQLGWPQVTYVEEVVGLSDKGLEVVRRLERGVERVRVGLPALLTVTGSAAACRPRHAKRVMRYKRASTPLYLSSDVAGAHVCEELQEWSAADLGADVNRLGLAGSPTKVKTVENVVFQVKEAQEFEGSRGGVNDLVRLLLANHTIG